PGAAGRCRPVPRSVRHHGQAVALRRPATALGHPGTHRPARRRRALVPVPGLARLPPTECSPTTAGAGRAGTVRGASADGMVVAVLGVVKEQARGLLRSAVRLDGQGWRIRKADYVTFYFTPARQ